MSSLSQSESVQPTNSRSDFATCESHVSLFLAQSARFSSIPSNGFHVADTCVYMLFSLHNKYQFKCESNRGDNQLVAYTVCCLPKELNFLIQAELLGRKESWLDWNPSCWNLLVGLKHIWNYLLWFQVLIEKYQAPKIGSTIPNQS